MEVGNHFFWGGVQGGLSGWFGTPHPTPHPSGAEALKGALVPLCGQSGYITLAISGVPAALVTAQEGLRPNITRELKCSTGAGVGGGGCGGSGTQKVQKFVTKNSPNPYFSLKIPLSKPPNPPPHPGRRC